MLGKNGEGKWWMREVDMGESRKKIEREGRE